MKIFVFALAIGLCCASAATEDCEEKQNECRREYYDSVEGRIRHSVKCEYAKEWRHCINMKIAGRDICSQIDTFPDDMSTAQAIHCYSLDRKMSCDEASAKCQYLWEEAHFKATTRFEKCKAARQWRRCVNDERAYCKKLTYPTTLTQVLERNCNLLEDMGGPTASADQKTSEDGGPSSSGDGTGEDGGPSSSGDGTGEGGPSASAGQQTSEDGAQSSSEDVTDEGGPSASAGQQTSEGGASGTGGGRRRKWGSRRRGGRQERKGDDEDDCGGHGDEGEGEGEGERGPSGGPGAGGSQGTSGQGEGEDEGGSSGGAGAGGIEDAPSGGAGQGGGSGTTTEGSEEEDSECARQLRACKSAYEAASNQVGKSARKICDASRTWEQCIVRTVIRMHLCSDPDDVYPVELYQVQADYCFKSRSRSRYVSDASEGARDGSPPAQGQEESAAVAGEDMETVHNEDDDSVSFPEIDECQIRQTMCKEIYTIHIGKSTDSDVKCVGTEMWRKCIEGIIMRNNTCKRVFPRELNRIEFDNCYRNTPQPSNALEDSCHNGTADAYALAFAIARAQAICPDGSVAFAVSESVSVGLSSSVGNMVTNSEATAHADAVADASEGGDATAISNSSAVAIDDGSYEDEDEDEE